MLRAAAVAARGILFDLLLTAKKLLAAELVMPWCQKPTSTQKRKLTTALARLVTQNCATCHALRNQQQCHGS
jgi:hypothetical protein